MARSPSTIKIPKEYGVSSPYSLLMPRLLQYGVSPHGARQALDGHVVTDPKDRQTIARILAAALGNGR